MKVWKRIALVLVVLGVLGVVVLYAGSARFLARTFPTEVFTPPIPTDTASIERGRHFGEALLDCGGCHGVDLGGGAWIDNAAIGHLFAPNLTRGSGGIGGKLTDADWVRAIRHGVSRDGRGLVFMSSSAYAAISNEDLADVIAWLKQVPPVDRQMPPLSIGPLGRALFWAGALPVDANVIDHQALEQKVRAPQAVPRGEYLARTSGCFACHGPDLKGVTLGDVKSTDITPTGLKGWTRAQFAVVMREGKRPDGTTVNPLMPSVRAFSKLSDEEIDDLWQWQQGLR